MQSGFTIATVTIFSIWPAKNRSCPSKKYVWLDNVTGGSPLVICSPVHTNYMVLTLFPEQDFQDSDWFFSKIHINPYCNLFLLTVCHTLHIFSLSSTDFKNVPGPVDFFQDFPVLEKGTDIKIPGLSRFSGTPMNHASIRLFFAVLLLVRILS